MKTSEIINTNKVSFIELDKLSSEWVSEFLENYSTINVSPVNKFTLTRTDLPIFPQKFEDIFEDFKENVFPGVNIWNHPGFMGYFNSSTTEIGIIAEKLTAAINANCMSYKSCPVGTDLEILTMQWLKEMLVLPQNLFGIMYEGGSSSNFHAMVAARQKILGENYINNGLTGIKRPLTAYFSNQTHSSIEKAALILGVGKNGIRKIPVDKNYAMDINILQKTILDDIKSGFRPFFVNANIGTTSCTAVDSIQPILNLCKTHHIWLHIDASHGGALAMLESKQYLFKGWEFADSITINPHKWFFVPLDLSVLLIKDEYYLKSAFSVQAEYLNDLLGNQNIDFMDYGISLGRRFRALKLWFTIKYLGVSGYKKILNNHIDWAQWLKNELNKIPTLKVNAPVKMSTVCFSYNNPNISIEECNNKTEKLLHYINNSGKFFLTHTKLNEVFVIRAVISSYRIEFSTVNNLMSLILKYFKK